ncbi:MAG: redoxin domain-containing protein [Planctomycetota bacterium]|nr:redoxin domain-containing protein [Planctomycetota bacterium]
MTSMHVSEPATPFSLPEAPGQMVDVGSLFGEDPVVLLFFPLAFSPVCTVEFCTIRDDWSRWSDMGAKVFGISIDSPFTVQKFKESEGLPFPLLSDFNKEVAASYGALHEDLMGLKGVAKRSAFVIDRSGKISYAWVSDDPGKQVEFEEILAAVQAC